MSIDPISDMLTTIRNGLKARLYSVETPASRIKGEIARVMLAVKTVLAEADTIPILIFDEIDANIGGETAARVGGELAKLGKHKQVICISHLAQAARCAETHFLVSKTPEEGTARTRIRRLEPKERLAEIARMLGGGKAALEHARELLKK